MQDHIIQIIRQVEELVHCTEVDPYAPIEYIKSNNESKLLEGLKPYIKTQHFKRYNDDPGYLESKIWMSYIRDAMFIKETKELKLQLNNLGEYNRNLQERIDDYNELSWWKKLFSDV